MRFGKRKTKSDDFDDLYVTEMSATPGSFLGALTSAMPDGFDRWQSAFDDALGRYADGSVSRTAALKRLQALVCVDVTGVEWTLGATTRQWYSRMPGQDWTPGLFPGDPTTDVVPVWEPEDAAENTEVVPTEPDSAVVPDWATEPDPLAFPDLEPVIPDGVNAPAPRTDSVEAQADDLVEQATRLLDGQPVTEPVDPSQLPELPSLTLDDLSDQPFHRRYFDLGVDDPSQESQS